MEKLEHQSIAEKRLLFEEEKYPVKLRQSIPSLYTPTPKKKPPTLTFNQLFYLGPKHRQDLSSPLFRELSMKQTESKEQPGQ